MPAASERAVNRALSGIEVKRLLLRDFEKLIANNGMLTDNIAYGRVTWCIEIGIQVDNPISPSDISHITSSVEPIDRIQKDPNLAAVEKFPMGNISDESATVAESITREVDSPNEERLRAGFPIPVDTKQQDSTIITENVQYPPQPELGDGNIKTEDTTKTFRKRKNL